MLALITEIVTMLPQMIQAGMDVAALIQKTREVIDLNTAPGNDDWATLDEQVRALQKELAADPPIIPV